MINKQLIKAGLIGALAMAPLQGVSAASGTTAVTVNFPDIIILHYISDLTLTFTGDVNEGVNQASASDSQALASTASFDSGLSVAGGTVIPGSVAVKVANVWAVRGITTGGKIYVNGNIDIAGATNDSSTATMSNLKVSSSGTAGETGIDAPGFAIGNAQLGDVQFDLDISGVTKAGEHTGMQYTITATATP